MALPILAPGDGEMVIIEFTPSFSRNRFSGDLNVVTNVGNTSICLSGTGLAAPIVSVTPNPMVVNLGCGDSITQNFVIRNGGAGTLNITGGKIGGAGINDTSLIGYTATGATTNHIFNNILNAGLDTLFVVAAVNGDFDQTTESAEVFIDGVLLGPIATGSLPLGDWDFYYFCHNRSIVINRIG